MGLSGNKSRAVFIGTGLTHGVLRFSAQPGSLFILGKCGRCGAQKDCEKVAFDGSMSNLTGSFICDCGTNVRLSVPLGFRRTGQ